MNTQKLTISYIKRQAKSLKRERNVSHSHALELIAKNHGFFNWKHCLRSLSEHSHPIHEAKSVNETRQISFTDWLKRHKNRNSPLGDLAGDMLQDSTWPLYNSLNEYRDYLNSKNACLGAVTALEQAWKSYRTYLKREESSKTDKRKTKKITPKSHDLRKIVYVSNITSIPYTKRTTEKFGPGDQAWISWNGRKAIPVTVLGGDDRHYTLRIERPIREAGNQHYLYLDEVRSTPELACMNYVTF